ncbi:MAG TPA: CopD family protein [Methylomirabilota bacterium]|nr:CopD family protein [Methylomirabilota bacterium]
MSVQFLVATGVRWAGLAALATLVGAMVVDVVVMPREAAELDPARRRLGRLVVVCLVVLVGTTAGELVARAQTMASGSLASAISAIPVVLTRTHFGGIWIARFALLALALLVSLRSSRAARVVLLGLALAVTVTTTLTGHAADWGDLTPSAAIDWIHVVAVSAWTGGLIAVVLGVLPRARHSPAPASLASTVRRFSRLAGWCLLAVLVSGGYNTWVQVSPLSALWTTLYGRVLAVKVLLVLVLIWWGALNRYTVVAALDGRHRAGIAERCVRLARLALRGPSRATRRPLLARLSAYARREALLAVVVLACTAVLVDSTPARHAEHAAHQVAEEAGPFRVTMEELHESGGVPKGWMIVPPAGDPAHGREVFVALGCYACHSIRGEKLPASSGLGPELTGVGQHHPAGYLLESVLNPNAVIVQGPGYTGPDGKSIMPDFRGQLSASDLIDLVAYLKSL